jgi:DNA-binding XRE family transcriptional regulator
VDDAKAGRLIRAVRVKLVLRQEDLSAMARVDRKVIYLIESGRLAEVSVKHFRRVCGALGIESAVDLRWHGGLGDRLIDTGHAAIVELVVATLRKAGWEVMPEFSCNVFGDRGSVDILAWHVGSRTLLIIEVKTRLTDLQATLHALSRKVRVVPGDAADRLGWKRAALGTVIVAAGTHGNRSVVEAHRATFEAVLPARTTAIKQWLRMPSGDLSGIWFVPLARGTRAADAVATRVRKSRAAGSPRTLPSAP